MNRNLRAFAILPRGRHPQHVAARDENDAKTFAARRFRLPIERIDAKDVTDELLKPRSFEERETTEGLRRILARGVPGSLTLHAGGREIMNTPDAYLRMQTGRRLERASDAWELRP